MSSPNEQGDYKELAEKIQQFLSHQIESNCSLSDSTKEGLSVAIECIENAYNFQRRPASRDLLDAYKAHKLASPGHQSSTTSGAPPPAGANANQTPPIPDPTQFITNLASSLFSQVGSSIVNAATGAANQQQQQQQAQQQQDTQSSSAQAPEQQSARPSAPKVRKNASEAEKIAAESFKNQGNDFMRLERFKEAYDCYTQAINIDDNNAVYYCNRAAASSKLENHQSTLDDCFEAIEIDANYSKAYGRMGFAYACMNNHQKAKEAYSKAVELDPTNESYRNNLAMAESKLAEAQGGPGGAAAAGLGAAAAAAAGAGGANMVNMLRSMMNNPEVMNMAMRSLQDPRVQSMFGLGGQQNSGQSQGQPR